ncbi:MAG: restriction endonuclease subunit S [Aquabacterium sp.]|nr:restriction endonuclease subunit S [Aquabacterium sp.]
MQAPILFSDLIAETKDGEWGEGQEAPGHVLCDVIRGTDFADLNAPSIELPQRWIPEHLVARKALQADDILIETAGGTAKQSTGRTALVTKEFLASRGGRPVLCSSFARHLRVDRDKVHPVYLYYVLQALYASGYMGVFNLQHTGVARFQFTTFRTKTRLTLHENAAQPKIAATLKSYDDLIANNQRRIALLESMAEEIYREWFVRMRFPGHDEVPKTKGIPVGWTPATLGAIASFVMGQSPSSEYYNETGDGLPFHQGVGTYGDRFPRHQVFCSSTGRKANAGDILFSVRAPVGRLNIADTELIIGRGLAAMRHKQGLNSYLFYLLKVTFANEDMIGNGSIFNSVGKDELAKHPVLCPPPELAETFETLVKPIDAQLATLYAATIKLSKQRDALLPRLISGKLRVDALDIQFPPSMQPPPAEAAPREPIDS